MKKTILLRFTFAYMLLCTFAANAQWKSPFNLSPNAVSAQLNESMGSCIATSNDTVHVIWVDRLGTNKGAVYYTHSVDTGLTWSAPLAITDTTGNAWNPAIAVNGQNIHVVWRVIDTLSGHRASWYKHSLDGGNTWGLPVFLDSTADWPAVAVSGNMVYVANDVVTAASPYNTEIFFLSSSDNGGTWSAPKQLTFAVGRSEDEAIHAEGSHVHMSWNDNRVGQFQILYKESNDYGVTWDSDMVVDPIKDYNTMVWSDGAHVDVIAAGAPSGKYQLLLAQSADTGATWASNMDLSNDTANTYFLPDMVRDGSDLHVVCNSSGGGKYFHSGNGGANWDTAVTLPGVTFIAYTGCVLHVIYLNAHDIYYLRNPTGNGGTSCSFTTGVEPLSKGEGEKADVSLYPNPSSDKIILNVSSLNQNEVITVSIKNVLGQEVISSLDALQKREENEVMDISTLPAGIYFLQIKWGSGVVIKKFVKG